MPEQLLPDEIERKKNVDLLSRARTLRDGARKDAGRVFNEDPARVYIWVHNSDQRKSLREGMGYRITKSKKDDKNAAYTQYRRGGGENVYGDLILMDCDRDEHDALKMLPEIEALELVSAPRADFLGFGQSQNVPVTALAEDSSAGAAALAKAGAGR